MVLDVAGSNPASRPIRHIPKSYKPKSSIDRSTSAVENSIMKIVCLCAAALSLAGLSSGQSQSAARVFVNPDGGMENYVISAIERRHVPVTVVDDRGKADFEIKPSLDGREAAVKVFNLRNGEVVYAWAGRGRAERVEKSAADACADKLNGMFNPRHLHRKSKLETALERDPAWDF